MPKTHLHSMIPPLFCVKCFACLSACLHCHHVLQGALRKSSVLLDEMFGVGFFGLDAFIDQIWLPRVEYEEVLLNASFLSLSVSSRD